jgi:hypothetical protein
MVQRVDCKTQQELYPPLYTEITNMIIHHNHSFDFHNKLLSKPLLQLVHAITNTVKWNFVLHNFTILLNTFL